MTAATRQSLFANWHPMRWTALVIGSILAVLAILNRDGLTGLFAAFFLFQAVTNSGCLSSQDCTVPANKPNKAGTLKAEEIEFTEIKQD